MIRRHQILLWGCIASICLCSSAHTANRRSKKRKKAEEITKSDTPVPTTNEEAVKQKWLDQNNQTGICPRLLLRSNGSFYPLPDEGQLLRAWGWQFGNAPFDRSVFLGEHLTQLGGRNYVGGEKRSGDEAFTGHLRRRNEEAKTTADADGEEPAFMYYSCNKNARWFLTFYFVAAEKQTADFFTEISKGDTVTVYCNDMSTPVQPKKSKRKNRKQAWELEFKVGINLVVVDVETTRAKDAKCWVRAWIKGKDLHQMLFRTQQRDL